MHSGQDRIRNPNSLTNTGRLEATVWTTCVNLDLSLHLSSPNQRIPIGRPISNTRLYVLDEWLEPVPIGVSGELYIGGAGLARGYLKRAGLTAQRFIANPFGEAERLYRSGDLVRYRADGNLEFIGRRDDQVKVRGYRIELGEVESALLGHAGVSQAVVVARQEETGEKRLVGYVVGEASLDVVQLREHMKGKLPIYMVPGALVQLERMPLSANGKIDRKALPAPEGRPEVAQYVEPRSEVEQALAAIWREVLRLDRVGVHDNFFELGGDSIQSIRIVARSTQAGLRLTVRQMFEHQTIAQLSGVMLGAPMQAEQGEVQGAFELTPIQHWYLDDEPVQGHHFNQSMLMRPSGILAAPLLEQALGCLLAHHDALRLRFFQEEGEWRQGSVRADLPVPFEQIDLSDLDELRRARGLQEQGERLQGSFDIEQGPLLRSALIELGGGEQRVLLIIHHLAVDAVSWGIVLEDLRSAYIALMSGLPVRLPAKSSSYKSWSQKLQEYARSETLREEIPYWLTRRTSTRIPNDYPEGENKVAFRRWLQVGLSEEQTGALLREVPRVYHTQINDVLLAALGLALRDWTGEERQLIALEGHGREELFEALDVSRTVGWFTSVFPVVLDMCGLSDAGAVLKGIKEQLRGIPRRGVGYGILKYIGRETEFSVSDEPAIAFNYLGQFTHGSGQEFWCPAKESAGDTHGAEGKRKYAIEFTGSVTQQGCLQFSCAYSERLHNKATVERLAQRFMEHLSGLIAHCQTSEGGYTPSDFALVRLTQPQLDEVLQESGGAAAVEDIYPASALQQGLIFHSLYAPRSTVYVVSVAWRLTGTLDRQAFESAWLHVVQRHALFRTGFVGQQLESLLQVVRCKVLLPFEHLDWRAMSEQQQELEFQRLHQSDRERGFDFTEPPLMRLTLIRMQEEEHRLLWSHHHALLDGWSMPILFNEVFKAYLAFSHQEQPQLPVVRPYRDYIEWLQRQDHLKAQEYWRTTLDGASALRLGIDRKGLAEDVAQIDRHAEYEAQIALPVSRLEGFAREHQLTLNSIVLGAWTLLLSRYSGNYDVLFGVTVAGRQADLVQSEGRVGLFVNSLPMRIKINPSNSSLQLLQQVQQRQSELLEYQYTPLAEIQRLSSCGPGVALFESSFVFENYPTQTSESPELDNLKISSIAGIERPHYALSMQVTARRGLALKLIFDTERFDREVIATLSEHFQRLLQEIIDRPQVPTSLLSPLSESERERILVQWNRTQREYPQDRCIHELFAEQAARTPQGIALQYEEQSLSYAELEARANQLAHYLRSLGVGPDVIVGLCVERSIEMVVGLLGILKAGGAYLPLDPEYPPERLAFMLEDAQASVLLTQSALRDRASAHTVVFLDQEWARIAEHAQSAPITRVLPHNLAYVIYTSGSTGEPKGSMLLHEGLTNQLSYGSEASICQAGVHGMVPVLQLPRIAFDALRGTIVYRTGAGATLCCRFIRCCCCRRRSRVRGRYRKTCRLPGYALIKLTTFSAFALLSELEGTARLLQPVDGNRGGSLVCFGCARLARARASAAVDK